MFFMKIALQRKVGIVIGKPIKPPDIEALGSL